MSKKQRAFDYEAFLFDGNDGMVGRIKYQYQVLLCHSYSRNNWKGF